MKFMLFTLLIVIMFPEKQSQITSFLSNTFLNLLFPKDPGLIRVRRMDKYQWNNAHVLDFIGLVELHHYPAEEHSVTTEDGYNLKIHRIPGSPLSDNRRKKEIVFLQHGILASSESWVLYGPGKDLAFLLADQGYDVWLGNMRGNNYCRTHTNMTIYDPKFWQYSFHEVGTKDLPAMFNYIFNHTNQKDLYYIGHSMGATSILALLSSKPEYNMKIKMAICLAPVAFWVKVTPLANDVLNTLPILKETLREREIYDVLPQSLATITIARTLCNEKAVTQVICIAVLFLIAGSDPPQLNITTLPDVLSYVPAGTSVQSVEHYYQNALANDFRNYDYGVAENYKRYKQKIPPSYDVKKISAPINIFYSKNDVIAIEENVLELDKRLPNAVTKKVPYKLFNHVDFLWAIEVKTLLFDNVLDLIQKFDSKRNKSKR